MGLPRLDVINVDNNPMLCCSPARHTSAAVFLERPIPEPPPFVCAQELRTSRVRQMARVGQPEFDTADEVEHSDTRESKHPRIQYACVTTASSSIG
jgi:hypothetical protein